jgi:SAM-dependent methyltransferase
MIKSTKLDSYRCGLTRNISGKVLEFGPGPGTNFRCWNQSDITEWVGVEPNTFFSEALDASGQKYGITFPRRLVWLNGENVNIEPSSFDAVVMTHVLCSVDDSVQVLRQADRALKPGGTIYLMEHVAAGSKDRTMRWLQTALAPFLYIAGNGCSFKETWKDITTALPGYHVAIEHLDLPIPLTPLAPHIVGTATKAG